MNTIIKEANKNNKKINWEKIKENYEENLTKLLEKHKINIYYENIDYFTAEIKENNSNIEYILKKLYIPYNHKKDIKKKQKHIELYNYILILNKFYLLNLWVIFGWQLQIYWIYDIDKNKLWSFTYKLPTSPRENYNAFTSLELTWLFFHSYNDYFDEMLSYFSVDRFSNWIIKRLDYCLDIKWVEVPELLFYLKELHQRQKIKNVNWLNHTDLKNLQEKNYNLQFWKTETYKKFLNNANTLIIYDKCLDIVQNYMLRTIDWINPYQDYVSSNLPITRIELKKTTSAFHKIQDNSINTMLSRIRPLFYDYLKKYFICDFSLLIWKNISLNWKKIYLAQKEKEIKITHTLTMIKAYLSNLETIYWKDWVYKFLFELYPDLENVSSLNLMDEFEFMDFYDQI